MTREASLTHGPCFWGMLSFGGPLALAMAFHGLFNCIDLIIVGRLGPGAVAAVTIGGIINMVSMLAFNGVANVIAGRTSMAAGQKDKQSLSAIVAAGRLLTKYSSAILGLLFLALAVPLTTVFGLDDSTESRGIAYFGILSVGSGTMFYLLFQSACLRSLGDSRHPTWALIGANGMNLALDVVLVFGLVGLPKMGVVGAAWATVLSRWLGALYLGGVLKRRQQSWPQVFPKLSMVLNILKQGLIHSAQMVVRVVSIYGLMIIAVGQISDGSGKQARDLLDGIGVGIRLEMVILFCALGWGGAAASFLGQNFGARKFHRAKVGLQGALFGALVSGLSLAIFLYFWPQELLNFVAPSADVDALVQGAIYLRIIILGHPGLLVAIVLSQALVGLGSVRTAVWLDFGLYVLVLIPMAYWFSQGSGNADSVWKCTRLIHLISAPLYFFCFGKRFLKEKQKVAANSEPVI